MLKTLLKKELQQIWFQGFLRGGKVGKNGKKRSSKGMIAVWAFLIVYLVGFFAFAAWMAGKQLLGLPGLDWLYYMLMGGAAVLFGALGSVFTTYASLYLAKDNDQLLSLPIPVQNIILSRLLGVYLMGLFYAGSFAIPAAVVGLIQCGFSLPRLIGSLVWVLLITLIVLCLSTLLGWVVARISVKLKSKSFLIVLLSLLFLGLYYVVYFRMVNHIQDLITGVIQFGESIRGTANPLYFFGRIGEGDWLAMLLWLAAVGLILTLIWLLLKKSFLSIATASAGGKKAVYREKAARQGSVGAALLRKEWMRFSSSSAYMLNSGLGAVFLLGMGVFLLIKGKEYIDVIVTAIPSLAELLPVLLCAVCCLMASMVILTAPSVSLEGRSIWLLQSLPVTAWQVLQAKLQLHLAVATPPTLFCVGIMALLTPATPAQKLLILAVALLFMLCFALLGLALGIRFANLNWSNENQPIKQSASVAITMFAAMGLALAIGGLYVWFGNRMGPTAWLSVCSLVLLAVSAALFLWLRNSGARRFATLSV